jgi:predicted PurR-regulated permease PerM
MDPCPGSICGLNAVCAIIFLAINDVPFFLPLGILSRAASLVPYAGPVVVAVFAAIVAWRHLGRVASAIFFVVYGQIESNVIAPVVFKRTVHVNPLVVLLSVLFFGE